MTTKSAVSRPKQAKTKKTVTEYRLGEGKIVIIDGFMSKTEARTMSNYFDHKEFTRSMADAPTTDSVKQWVFNFSKKDLEGFEEKMIRDEITTHFGHKSFKILSAICNSYAYGDACFIHVDAYKSKPCITALIFANAVWEKDWGGEIMFFNSDDEAVYAVTPKPGRLLLFDGFIKHRAGVPSRHCYDSRKTFVIKYLP